MKWSCLFFALNMVVCIGLATVTVHGQQYFTHTTDFQQKLNHLGLYYYEPTEAWLHPIPSPENDYGPFDLVLESSEESVQIMYRFKEINSANDLMNHPNLDMYQYVATLASNDQNTNITLTGIEHSVLDTIFNADWGLYADFVPKQSLSPLPHCRLLAIYKEEHAMVYSMIFYKEELPEYFELPISFQE